MDQHSKTKIRFRDLHKPLFNVAISLAIDICPARPAR